jgi:hypothetical protein
VLAEITDPNLSSIVKLLNVTFRLMTSAEYLKKLFSSKFLPQFSCCTARCNAQNKLKFGAKMLVTHLNFGVKICYVNFLKPTGNFTYHNFQHSKIIHCDHMEFVCISEQTVNFALYNIKRLVFITEVESVYCAVRTGSLYNTETFRI